MTAIVKELNRAADILVRCADRIDALRNQDEDSESDRSCLPAQWTKRKPEKARCIYCPAYLDSTGRSRQWSNG